jgi:hypothetical protein
MFRPRATDEAPSSLLSNLVREDRDCIDLSQLVIEEVIAAHKTIMESIQRAVF